MLVNMLKEMIQTEEFETKLKDIYEDESALEYQKNRYINAVNKYMELYSDLDVEIYSAAGRSEISGNHTDHQHGRVLAGSINLDAIAIVSRQKNIVKIVSDDMDISPIDIYDLDK